MRRAMFKMVVVFLCAGMLVAASVVAGCGSSGQKVSVGVLTDYPGMSSMDAVTGEYSGYEEDVAREVFTRVYGSDVQVNFVGVSGDTRETELDSNHVDAIIACYTITDERRELRGISDPYYDASVRVLVRTDSGFSSVKDMDGCTVGVLAGSTTGNVVEAYAASQGVTVFTVDYDTFLQARDGLRGGVVDGFSTDGVVLQNYLDDETMLLPDSFDSQQYGMVVAKDDTDLLGSMNAALASMEEDGTLDSLREKWGL